ncbi:hypothetical protein H9Q69_008037 [Fusarium xylarioides]|nr:hypothetical protein H9Q69_008037 [Fusarium xylarioides]
MSSFDIPEISITASATESPLAFEAGVTTILTLELRVREDQRTALREHHLPRQRPEDSKIGIQRELTTQSRSATSLQQINEVDGSQSSQANSLDMAMPSQPDMFPAYLSGSPLEFNASFMDPDLINPNLSGIFDLGALLADTQGLFGQAPICNPPELPILALEPTTLGQTDKSCTPRNLVANDNKCENAWANLTKYPAHILASLRFPSKYAVGRFVKAFFKHIAPHIPILHELTFDIATTPCGTVCSKEQEAWIPTPMVEARFALPSSNAEWLKEESSWSTPAEVLYSNDALDSVIGGQQPSMPVSEFGLVTIVSALLYRICSFELLTGSRDGELYAKFGKKMEQSLQVLDAILKARMIQYDGGLAPNPTVHCARSLLNSAFYHLHASVPLSIMKKILWSPASLDDPEIVHLLNEAISPELYQALFNAADQLRSDCRVGLTYIKKIAPIIFGPESAVGALEGCLLLCWYLQFAKSRVSHVESRDILNALINESFAEVTDLQLGHHGLQSVLPLAVSAELLSDGSMWKWPSSVSQKLKSLIKKLEDSDTTIHVATAYLP